MEEIEAYCWPPHVHTHQCDFKDHIDNKNDTFLGISRKSEKNEFISFFGDVVDLDIPYCFEFYTCDKCLSAHYDYDIEFSLLVDWRNIIIRRKKYNKKSFIYMVVPVKKAFLHHKIGKESYAGAFC